MHFQHLKQHDLILIILINQLKLIINQQDFIKQLIIINLNFQDEQLNLLIDHWKHLRMKLIQLLNYYKQKLQGILYIFIFK